VAMPSDFHGGIKRGMYWQLVGRSPFTFDVGVKLQRLCPWQGVVHLMMVVGAGCTERATLTGRHVPQPIDEQWNVPCGILVDYAKLT